MWSMILILSTWSMPVWVPNAPPIAWCFHCKHARTEAEAGGDAGSKGQPEGCNVASSTTKIIKYAKAIFRAEGSCKVDFMMLCLSITVSKCLFFSIFQMCSFPQINLSVLLQGEFAISDSTPKGGPLLLYRNLLYQRRATVLQSEKWKLSDPSDTFWFGFFCHVFFFWHSAPNWTQSLVFISFSRKWTMTLFPWGVLFFSAWDFHKLQRYKANPYINLKCASDLQQGCCTKTQKMTWSAQCRL